tara:strand:- start:37 stop:279 length:243 start_codon:yes stop_codon:yes gene_type:complete
LDKISGSLPNHQFPKGFPLKIDDFDEFGQKLRISPRSSIFTLLTNLDKISGSLPDHQFSKGFPLKIDDFDELKENRRFFL